MDFPMSSESHGLADQLIFVGVKAVKVAACRIKLDGRHWSPSCVSQSPAAPDSTRAHVRM